MGWRKDLVEAIYDMLTTRQTAISNVQIWNKDFEEGLRSGKIPKAPFIIMQYAGFTNETLGNCHRRIFTVPLVVGISGLRGEQAAFTGLSSGVSVLNFDDVLGELENALLESGAGEEDETIANASPIVVDEEEYLGRVNEVELWGITLSFNAVFSGPTCVKNFTRPPSAFNIE